MEILIFLLLSLAGISAFVAGAKVRLPLLAYFGLGLLLIAATANTIDGLYYRSGETEFTVDNETTYTAYNYTNYNTTAVGGTGDWYLDATSYLMFVFALLSLGWYANSEPIGET